MFNPPHHKDHNVRVLAGLICMSPRSNLLCLDTLLFVTVGPFMNPLLGGKGCRIPLWVEFLGELLLF